MANKRYDQFTAVAPTTSRIILHADAATGALGKCTIADELALVPATPTYITALQLLGSSIKSTSLFANPFLFSSSTVMSLNHLWVFYNYLPACTVTGVWFAINGNGNFTASGFNGFGLYDTTTTTASLRAQTANNPNFFKTATGAFNLAPFTSPYTVTAGNYWLGIYYSASAVVTAPTLMVTYGSTNFIGNSLGFSNGWNSAFELGNAGALVTSFLWSSVPTANRVVPLCGFY